MASRGWTLRITRKVAAERRRYWKHFAVGRLMWAMSSFRERASTLSPRWRVPTVLGKTRACSCQPLPVASFASHTCSSSLGVLPVISKVYLAPRSHPLLGHSSSSLNRPRRRPSDRLATVLAVETTKAAEKPQIAPITAPENEPSVHHRTPRPTNKDMEINTIKDNITVPAILAIILVPFPAYSLRAFSPR